MTDGDGDGIIRRQYHACINCRMRKQKCDLGPIDNLGPPPCKRCKREGKECFFAKQQRGGNKQKFGSNEGSVANSSGIEPASNEGGFVDVGTIRRSSTSNGSGVLIAETSLQNPSHALDILAEAGDSQYNLQQESYELVQRGVLSQTQVEGFIHRYIQHFHPFFPILVINSDLPTFCSENPVLLTAILVVASADRPEVNTACWDYMKHLIMEIVFQSTATIDAVEALLILSEWCPRPGSDSVGKGEEERTSWMLIGIALRLAYFLGIDRAAFGKEKSDRRRLLWTYCYFLDRQISVRVGKAFWSRGPGPTVATLRADFPTLKPHNLADCDYASLLQAQLDLTQLFTNVHDVLYPSQERTYGLMEGGDYIKYLDDFDVAVENWYEVWKDVAFPQILKTSLLMMFHYLRLYLRAFAFEATLYRNQHEQESWVVGQPYFPSGIGSVGDARFIFGSINDAKRVLELILYLDPETTLRFMPGRYYLYAIYASVFLIKVIAAGATMGSTPTEMDETIERVIDCLHAAGTDQQHIGARYSLLLRALKRRSLKNRTEPILLSPSSLRAEEHDYDYSFLESMPAALDGDINKGFLPFGNDLFDSAIGISDVLL